MNLIDLNKDEINSCDEFTRFFILTYNKVLKEELNRNVKKSISK